MPRTATSTIDAKVVGARLKRARVQEGLTQAGLAERLDVSAAYVQKLESGRANPTLGQLANIANSLGRSLEIDFSVLAESSDPLAEFASR
jgi:transcriptional regulator with XRE-family HTH domain